MSCGRFAWLLILLLEMELNIQRWCDSCRMYVKSSCTKVQHGLFHSLSLFVIHVDMILKLEEMD